MSTSITNSSFISPTQKRFHSKSQITPHDHSYYPIIHQSSFNSFKLNSNHKFSIRAVDASDESHGKATPDLKKSSSSGWKKWVVGFTLSTLIPSFGHKLPPLLILKSKLDNVLQKVETVSELVEELAEETEKVVEEVNERLPQAANKLKEATQLVDNLAKAVDKEAQLTQQLIHKVEVVEKEVEELIEAAEVQEKTVVQQTKP